MREGHLAIESLIAELKRRRVFRVLVGYGVVSFAVLQVIEPIMHALRLPDPVLTYCVIALALGFPIVVVLAWAFDVNAGGIERTAATAGAPRGTRLGLLLLGIGVLAAAPGLVWYLFARGGARAPATAADDKLKAKLDSIPPASEIRAPPSIAVLPFADMSPRHDQDYFSDGIAEEILNALAQVEGLRVIGRTSSFSFKGKNEDLRVIGEKLGAAHVLEGSVRTEGDRIRITAQLIESAGGSHLWSKTFDREMKSVFAVQDEIAAAVVEALKVKLLPDRAAPQKAATSPEAYAQFLLGRQLSNRQGAEDYRGSVEAYEKAIALDPNYAPAHAGLSFALGYQVNLATTTPEARFAGQRRALAEAERAIALAPGLPDGYFARGKNRIAFMEDWRGTREDLDHAIALAPGDARARIWRGHLYAVLGRLPEAVASTRKGLELDPLDAFAWDFLGRYQAAAGDLAQARASFDQALSIAPGAPFILRERSFTDLLGGNPAAVVRSAETQGGWLRLLGLALAHHDLGEKKEARTALDAMIALDDPPAYQIAQVYAWWGDRDRAFHWLERARSTEDAGLRYVKYDPLLRSLRPDPRYTALLRKMKLPVD